MRLASLARMKLQIYLFLVSLLILLTWIAGDARLRTATPESTSEIASHLTNSANWEIAGATKAISINGNSVVFENPTNALIRAFSAVKLPMSNESKRRVLRVQGNLQRASERKLNLTRKKHTIIVLQWLVDGQRKSLAAIRFSNIFRENKFELLLPEIEGADTFVMSIAANVQGVWQLQDLDITFEPISWQYRLAIFLLIGAWFVAIAFGLRGLLSVVGPRNLILLGVILVVTLIGISLSQPLMIQLLQSMSTTFSSDLGIGKIVSFAFALKLGHAIMFGILCLFLLAIRQTLKLTILNVVVICLLFAWATESIQRHQYTRSAQTVDIVIDGLGIAAALIIWMLVLTCRRIKGQQSQPN